MGKSKKPKEEANPLDVDYVKLRMKELSKGRKSLYLDIYKYGNRNYEFLDMYLEPEINQTAVVNNRKTMLDALAIRNERYDQLINGESIFGIKHKARKILLTDWLETFRKQKAKSGQSKSNSESIGTMIKYLKDYNADVKLSQVDERYCRGFIDFLSNVDARRNSKNPAKLSKSAVRNYFAVFSTALNEAVRRKLIPSNPANNLSDDDKKPMRGKALGREYLTIDEVKMLINAECGNENVKRAFLFSCFTGLRLSDIIALEWQNIIREREGIYLSIIMQKTSNRIKIKLNDNAVKWLPVKKNEDVVFNLPLSGRNAINPVLKHWAKRAGITKNVSFHIARHTFATMELTVGADLYTVSKLMGHKNIAVTQIYADIINKKRDEAIDLLDAAFKD